jgi:hypothetical protein
MRPDLWLEAAREVPLLDVARGLGLDLRGRGRSLSPCPGCGEDRRGSGDKRGPIGLTRDGGGWACHRCDAKGDGLALASWVLNGGPLEGRERAATVRAFYAAQGWCEPAGDANRTTVRRSPPRRPRPAPEPPPARERTPEEVGALWSRCVRVCDDGGEVAAYLEGRGIPAGAVEDLDLARALPADAILPPWAGRAGRPWPISGHRLIVPLFDSAGVLVTLQAVAVNPAEPSKLWPRGGGPAGAVFADPLARLWLSREPMGDGSDPAEAVRRYGLVVAEGAPDFLTWATNWGEACEDAPAVVAVAAGSWTAELAARVPDGTNVTLATHPDKAGDRYAQEVARSLSGRCSLRRWRPPEGAEAA